MSQSNHSLDDPTFLDAPEVEVMPGVYMTDFAAIKREANKNQSDKTAATEVGLADGLNDGYVPTPGDIAAMQSHQSHLQTELQMLETQLAMLHHKLTLSANPPRSQIGPLQLCDPSDSNKSQSQGITGDGGEERYMTLGELTGLTGVHLLEQIVLKIDQLTKHHEHLKHSQEQLKELLSMNDPDITEAYDENKITLIEQVKRLEALKDEQEAVMKSLGGHYNPAPSKTETEPPNDPTQSTTTRTGQDSKDDSSGVWL